LKTKFKGLNYTRMTGAFVIGGTGEVGKCLVHELASNESFDRVVLFVRREQAYDGPNKEKLVSYCHYLTIITINLDLGNCSGL